MSILAETHASNQEHQPTKGQTHFNKPEHVVDFRIANGCSQLIRGREYRRDASELVRSYRMFNRERRDWVALQAGERLVDAEPEAPTIVVDDPVFDPGEIGVEYDLRADPDRLDRFDALLLASSILRGVKDHERGQYLSGTFHADHASVKREIDKLWEESA